MTVQFVVLAKDIKWIDCCHNDLISTFYNLVWFQGVQGTVVKEEFTSL